MKTILVAGGAGFIGGHLCRALMDQGHRVIVVDNLVTGSLSNIEDLLPRGLQFIEADVCDPLGLSGKLDQIYNLASPASPVHFKTMPIFILRTGLYGHENLLRLAVEHGARLLLGSTSEVYGDPLEHPQREDYAGNVSPVGERSCYDEAKRGAEALSFAYLREKKADVCVARIFNTYGPGMSFEDGRLIPNLFARALRDEALTIYGDGSQTRSFCYVGDQIRGLQRLMESGRTGPYNIGNPEEVSVLRVAEIVKGLTENAHPYRFMPLPSEDPRRRRPDISAIRRDMDWSPEVSLEQGLRATWEFIRSEALRPAL